MATIEVERLVGLLNSVSDPGEEFSVDDIGSPKEQPICRRNHYRPDFGWRPYSVIDAIGLVDDYKRRAMRKIEDIERLAEVMRLLVEPSLRREGTAATPKPENPMNTGHTEEDGK